MQPKRFYYLISFQYLGFRYHGWQVQPNVKTVELMVKRTLNYILPEVKTKVLVCSRTDAKVSANQTYLELFCNEQLIDLEEFMTNFNLNLPSDIRALSIKEVDKNFNVIQDTKFKTYHYYFAFGEKIHPFSAAIMANINYSLDIELMKKAALQFKGKKDFYSYTFRPNENTNTIAEIFECRIEENIELTASFFPKTSYVLKVTGKGFKRGQIRLMMGMLIDLGNHAKTYDFFLKTLDGTQKIKLEHVAPASGLILHEVNL